MSYTFNQFFFFEKNSFTQSIVRYIAIVWEPLHLDHNICGVSDVTPWDYAKGGLPIDIDSFPFSKFAKHSFQVGLIVFVISVNPLKANTTRWSNTLKKFVAFCQRII